MRTWQERSTLSHIPYKQKIWHGIKLGGWRFLWKSPNLICQLQIQWCFNIQCDPWTTKYYFRQSDSLLISPNIFPAIFSAYTVARLMRHFNLNQAHAAEGHAYLVSWNCFGSCVGMHVWVSVCLPPRALITSGLVRLVKQVSLLFPAFNYFIWHSPSIKWMDMAILTQHVMNTCQRKLRWHGTSYKRTTRKMEHFIYKSEWANA